MRYYHSVMNTAPVAAWQQPPFRPMIQTEYRRLPTQPHVWLQAGVGAMETPLPLRVAQLAELPIKAVELVEVPNITKDLWRGFAVSQFGIMVREYWQWIWDQIESLISISTQLVVDGLGKISDLLSRIDF